MLQEFAPPITPNQGTTKGWELCVPECWRRLGGSLLQWRPFGPIDGDFGKGDV